MLKYIVTLMLGRIDGALRGDFGNFRLNIPVEADSGQEAIESAQFQALQSNPSYDIQWASCSCPSGVLGHPHDYDMQE